MFPFLYLPNVKCTMADTLYLQARSAFKYLLFLLLYWEIFRFAVNHLLYKIYVTTSGSIFSELLYNFKPNRNSLFFSLYWDIFRFAVNHFLYKINPQSITWQGKTGYHVHNDNTSFSTMLCNYSLNWRYPMFDWLMYLLKVRQFLKISLLFNWSILLFNGL